MSWTIDEKGNDTMIRRMTASVTLLLLLAAGARADERLPLQKLDWLIGAWEFDDSEVNGDYRETGTRVCAYGLDDQYIICKSKGVSSSGNERTYHWYINYNKVDDRFEMTSLLGNFPRKLLHTLTVSADGHRIDLVNHDWSTEGVTATSSGTITYNGSDEYIWNNRSGEADPDTGENAINFRDIVTRR